MGTTSTVLLYYAVRREQTEHITHYGGDGRGGHYYSRTTVGNKFVPILLRLSEEEGDIDINSRIACSLLPRETFYISPFSILGAKLRNFPLLVPIRSHGSLQLRFFALKD
jgi:hypothetical protein